MQPTRIEPWPSVRSLSEPFSWLWRTWGVSPLRKVGMLAGDPVCVSGWTPLSSEDTEDLCRQGQDGGKSLRLGADKFRLNEERILWSEFWAEKHQKKTLPSFRPSWENSKKAACRTSPLGWGPGFCRGLLRLVACPILVPVAHPLSQLPREACDDLGAPTVFGFF